MKNAMFDVFDKIKDLQLSCESAQKRINGLEMKLSKYLGKRPEWKFQHKYSQRMGNSCVRDSTEVSGQIAEIDKLYNKLGKAMVATSKATITKLQMKISDLDECKPLMKVTPHKPKRPVISDPLDGSDKPAPWDMEDDLVEDFPDFSKVVSHHNKGYKYDEEEEEDPMLVY